MVVSALASLLIGAGTASARGVPAAQTRVLASYPVVTTVVGVAEHIAVGQRRSRAPSQLQAVVGQCVAAETEASVLARPTVESGKLQNVINDLYKGTTNPNRVGSGMSMANSLSTSGR